MIALEAETPLEGRKQKEPLFDPLVELAVAAGKIAGYARPPGRDHLREARQAAQCRRDDGRARPSSPEELGIDAIGAAPAAPYDGDRAAHPRTARARASSPTCASRWRGPRSPAIRRRCCRARAPSSPRRSATTRRPTRRAPGEGRLPRYTWNDAYAELREKLDALGRRLGGVYRVLVDANQHVDREGAARAGVGFYGKNTMLITRRHGSWVVLGHAVTDVELEPSPPLEPGLRRVPALHRRLPDRRARRAGHARRESVPLLLDAGAGADTRGVPRKPLGAMVYGCDICQDVCPWNRGVEKRRAGTSRRTAEPVGFARGVAAGATARRLSRRYERLYVPRNDPRYLRRNALVALGNVGRPRMLRSPSRTRTATTSCCASTQSGRYTGSERGKR